LACSIHLSLLGTKGFAELARTNGQNARNAVAPLEQNENVSRAFPSPFFNEFCIQVRGDLNAKLDELAQNGILAGVPLARFYPELDSHLLVYVNEMTTADQIGRLAEGL
jgi:glycine dehydrogenase subunit 1